MKPKPTEIEVETVEVFFEVYDEEEILALCECEVEAKIATIDASFDWEGGVREEYHQEVINYDDMADCILSNFVTQYKTSAFQKVLKRLIDIAVVEYSTTSNDTISHEIDLIDFLKTEKL